MEKLTQIMNSFENFLEKYDTCSKKKMVYNWQQLEREIKDILEEKENKTNNLTFYYMCSQCKGDLIAKEIKEQIIKCDCGVKYHMSDGGILTPIKEVETNSWQDGNIRKWKCGCDGLMTCETGSDSVITCLKCHKKYAWDDKLKRMTHISEVKEQRESFAIDMDQAIEFNNKFQNLVKEINNKNESK